VLESLVPNYKDGPDAEILDFIENICDVHDFKPSTIIDKLIKGEL
jgi:hypothetical protein